MKRVFLFFAFITAANIAALELQGYASWYGPGFAGKLTASGEVFDPQKLTAAHRDLPFGTKIRVTNLSNNRTVVVTINDRGPFVKNRIIDLSKKAAEELDMIKTGTALVKLEIISIPKGQERPVILQAGAFKDKKNAEQLCSLLKKHKISAIIEETHTNYKVIVYTKSSLEKATREKLAKLGIKNVFKRNKK
ncbi:septal ring lytic transglycosylase RlpA family protein [Spirochaetia bacterium 38H-sp]|uniref:Probable endolytic peptidoglycan transglycosylase RlpA n=1 Tax=Rarispira pelagica TaxID=3141764 RepID=A0ABU9UBR7_9SPIR